MAIDLLVDELEGLTTVSLEDLNQARDELRQARETILELAPDGLGRVLRSYTSYSARERHVWLSKVVEQTLDAAQPLAKPDTVLHLHAERARCPLCRQGRRPPYEYGFAFPTGLRLHLTGESNARQCRVVRAALALASDHFDQTSEDVDGDEDEVIEIDVVDIMPDSAGARGADVDAEGDPLVLTSPHCIGKSLASLNDKARTRAELALAGSRLSLLGFERKQNGRVCSFTRSGHDYVVYADPRATSVIWFHCFTRRDRSDDSAWQQRFPSLRVRDVGKQDLVERFEPWLAARLSS